MKIFYLFQIVLLKYSLKDPIINVFQNNYEKKIGFLDNKGKLYEFQSNDQLKIYGNLNFKSIGKYEENGNKWILETMDKRIFFNNKWLNTDSSLLYNKYSNSSYIQVFQNKTIFKDGTRIVMDNKIYEYNWEKVKIHNDIYVIVVDSMDTIFIYDMNMGKIVYEEKYVSLNPILDINISYDHNFYYIYFGYYKKGIRCLLFYGGFNNAPIEKSFLQVNNLKKFKTENPYIYIHNDNSFLIYKKERMFKYEEKERIFFPYRIDNLYVYKKKMYTFLSNEIFLLKFK